LHPDQGYDGRCLGNLAGEHRLGQLRAARNHALVAPVAVGTPRQPMRCLLDAGGADLWLPSRRCTSCAANAKERSGFFDAAESSTFKTLSVMTQFGPSLRMLRLDYGGGSARGLVANETIKLASATVAEQTFLLAEVGGPDAREDRSWDGVCGIGRHHTEHGGTPFHERLPEALYVLSPAPKRSEGGEISRLAVGPVPDGLVEPSSTLWVNAAPPDAHTGGLWAVDVTISIRDQKSAFTSRPARAAFETGTSFLLAPPDLYLPFVRTLLPDGSFDELCGVDASAGNVVVCSCEARRKVKAGVTIGFADLKGTRKQFSLRPEDLFEEARTTSSSGTPLCVLQVQQRPRGSVGNVLGSSALAKGSSGGGGPGADLPPPAAEARLQKTAASAHDLLPATMPRTRQVPRGSLFLGKPAGSVHERAVELLGDGTRCETELVRAANGTVVAAGTTTDSLGGRAQLHKLACAHLLHSLLGPAGELPRRLDGLLIADGAAGQALPADAPDAPADERDVWVLGDVFLRRHALLLDFRGARLGIGTPIPEEKDVTASKEINAEKATAGAAVEALVSGRPSVAIQTYDQSALGGSLAMERIRTAAAHLLHDPLGEQMDHVRTAAAHLLGDPVPPHGVLHLRSAAADLLWEHPESEPAEEPAEAMQGPQPSSLSTVVLGCAVLGGTVMAVFGLQWQLRRMESGSAVRRSPLMTLDTDEETAGLAME